MSDASVCDNCKREPEHPFVTEDGEKAYWLRVPKENQDPSILTSALDFAFCAMVSENGDKRHPDNDPDNFYWCSDCCIAAYPEQDVL